MKGLSWRFNSSVVGSFPWRKVFIQTFYNSAFKKVQRVTERYRKMEEVYTQVCTLFGENPKVVEPSDFFKTFIDFMANYKVDR